MAVLTPHTSGAQSDVDMVDEEGKLLSYPPTLPGRNPTSKEIEKKIGIRS